MIRVKFERIERPDGSTIIRSYECNGKTVVCTHDFFLKSTAAEHYNYSGYNKYNVAEDHLDVDFGEVTRFAARVRKILETL